jgi:hypothetical protein
MGMEKSLRLGSQLIEQVWERMNPNELPKMRQYPEDRILVVRGSYDHIEKILNEAKVPYTGIKNFPDKEDLQQGGKYSKSRVMFVNCDGCYHGAFEGKNLSGKNKSALINFVSQGGRMITTDWAQAVVKYLFGKIWAKEDVTGDEVVKCKFSSDLAAKLSGITYGNAKPNWWLEESSDIIHYRSNSGIVELVESEELEKKYGSKHIAIGFQYGEGEVFHFVSHLIAQKLANYDKRDRECLSSFLDATKTKLRDADKSRLTFGEIQTTYTLMNTVLELCRDNKILTELKGGNV